MTASNMKAAIDSYGGVKGCYAEVSSPAICADAGGAAGAPSEPGPSQEPPQKPPHLAETDQGIEKVMLACQEEGCIKSLVALKKHVDVGKHMVRLAKSQPTTKTSGSNWTSGTGMGREIIVQ